MLANAVALICSTLKYGTCCGDLLQNALNCSVKRCISKMIWEILSKKDSIQLKKTIFNQRKALNIHSLPITSNKSICCFATGLEFVPQYS